LSRQISILKDIDWLTIALYVTLVVGGWFAIYGAVYNYEDAFWGDFSQKYGKQLAWIVCSFITGAILLTLDSRVYNILAYFLYVASIFLLIITILIARDINGSRSWLELGPISLQPVEFSKAITCLAMAKFMSSYGFKISNIKDATILAFIILLPFGLILLQRETGSAIVYSALLFVLYREGMPGIILLLVICCSVFFIMVVKYDNVGIIAALPQESYGMFLVMIMAIITQIVLIVIYCRNVTTARNILLGNIVLFGVTFLFYRLFHKPVHFTYVAYASIGLSIVYLSITAFFRRNFTYVGIAFFLIGSIIFSNTCDYIFDNILQPHQQERIKETLGMKNDTKGGGYNVDQSVIAIGSGGLTGKGFLNGTQTKLKYVPARDTDFIFCTVGEEHGFVGSVLVLSLYLILLMRLIYLAERQRSPFSRIYGYCVTSILFFHFAINIGMVVGLTPVIGIPLPFFSYGGSSLLAFTILLFIFIRLDASRREYLKN